MPHGIKWIAEWGETLAQKGPGSNRSCDAVMLLGNSLRQTVHTNRASVHQAAKLVAALLRVAGVTAGLAESNGSLPPGLWLASPAGWLPRTEISSGTLSSVMEYGLPLPFYQYSSHVEFVCVVVFWCDYELLKGIDCLFCSWWCLWSADWCQRYGHWQVVHHCVHHTASVAFTSSNK